MKGPFETWMKISKIKSRWGQTKYLPLIMFKEYILLVTSLSSCLFLVQKEHGVFACFLQLKNKTFHFKKCQSSNSWSVKGSLGLFVKLRDLLKTNLCHQSISALTDDCLWGREKKSLVPVFLTTPSNFYFCFENLLPYIGFSPVK